MGTRSIIAAEFDTDNGVEIKGVYAHWDGYPEHMLVALKEIVARDGRDAAVEELFREGGQGWSVIRPSEDGSSTRREASRFRAVPGYGERFLDAPEASFMTLNDSEEFFYIIRKDGEVVWTEGQGSSGPWYNEVETPIGFDSYTDPAPLAGAVDIDDDIRTEVVAAVRNVLAEAGVPDDQMAATIVKLFAKLSGHPVAKAV